MSEDAEVSLANSLRSGTSLDFLPSAPSGASDAFVHLVIGRVLPIQILWRFVSRLGGLKFTGSRSG